MRKLIFLIPIILVTLPIHASFTQFQDTVAADTTWGPDTVRITGEVTVNEGVTLDILPGTVIIFDDVYSVNVQGRIVACGSETDSIIFSTFYSSDLWGGFDYIKTPLTNDSSIFEYCRIDRAELDGIGVEGGAFCCDSFGKVRLENCLIANSGGSGINMYGAGIYCRYADIRIVNCHFFNNSADGSICGGGGLYLHRSDPLIVNTLFSFNSGYGSMSNGGAIYCDSSSPQIIYCTFVRNKSDGAAGSGAGIYCVRGSSPQVWGSIFWANDETQVSIADTASAPDFYYCLIQGGESSFYGAFRYRGTIEHSITNDPFFTDLGNFDYTLSAASPCINTGPENTDMLFLPDLDLAGSPRIYQGNNPRIDMGVYEYQGEPASVRPHTVNQVFQKVPVSFCYNPITGIIIRKVHGSNGAYILKLLDTEGRILWQGSVSDGPVAIPRSVSADIYLLFWEHGSSGARGICKVWML